MTGRRLKSMREKEICPICEVAGWCAWLDEDAVVCARVEQGCLKRRNGESVKVKGGQGWVHRLGGNKPYDKPAKLAARSKPRPHLTIDEIRKLYQQHQKDLDAEYLKLFADSLGLTVKALKAYWVGYERASGCFTFLMFDGTFQKGKPVPCGIRRRWPQEVEGKNDDLPRYGSVLRSRNGLFLPTNYLDGCKELPEAVSAGGEPMMLLLPEGPTSGAAAFDLGFRAVGRFNNMGGGDLVRRLLANSPCRQEVIVVADHEGTKWRNNPTLGCREPYWPGWEGALNVCEDLLADPVVLKVVKPPEKAKDLRDWLLAKGTAGVITSIVADAVPVTAGWLLEKKNEVERWRTGLRKTGSPAAGNGACTASVPASAAATAATPRATAAGARSATTTSRR